MDEKYQRLKASTLRLSWLYYSLILLLLYVFHADDVVDWTLFIFIVSMVLLLEFSFKCYQLVSGQVLGKGSFGKAYLVKNTEVPSMHTGIKPTSVVLLFSVLKPQNYLSHRSYQSGIHWYKNKINTDRWISDTRLVKWWNTWVQHDHRAPPKGSSCKTLKVLTKSYQWDLSGTHMFSLMSRCHPLQGECDSRKHIPSESRITPVAGGSFLVTRRLWTQTFSFKESIYWSDRIHQT